MKIGLVGPSYQERSHPFDAQRTINLYPVLDEKGKEVSALYGTPGLDEFVTAGNGPIRGEFCASNGRGFAVSGSSLYEIFSGGTATFLGTLSTSSGNVSIDENGLQLGICDETYVYTFTYSSGVYAKVTDGDLPSAGTLTFIDTYFVINKNSSGAFYISANNDGTSWDPLDFATAESSPDNLLRVFNAVGQLWLFGSRTTEIWTNTGAAAFPFARISGAKMEVGILAPHTTVAVDNSVFWVGQDSIGNGIVYRAQGFSPQRISTSPIEMLLQQATTPSTMRGYTYQQDGHTFYVITGGGLDTSLVYDISTQQWHERAFLESDGTLSTHRGIACMYAFGKHLVGDKENGKIYEMSQDFYDDAGTPLKAQRIFTHLSDEGKRFKASQLQVDFENGPSLIDNAPFVALGADPMQTYLSPTGGSSVTTVSGSNIITVHDTNVFVLEPTAQTLFIGDSVTFSGFPAVNGISAAALNKAHMVYSVDRDNSKYTVVVSDTATSTGFGSGSVVFDYGWLLTSSTAHGLRTGDRITVSGATAIGTITAAQINTTNYVIKFGDDSFFLKTSGLSAADGFGGGSSVTYQKVLERTTAVATLSISRDGARTWSQEYEASLGALGNYRSRAVWRRLGYAEQMTFRLTITDPVKRAICGAYLR